LPRLRAVTNDPAREYAQRPGEVEKLPDSVAALILSKQGYSKVQRNGIVVEGVTRKPLKFWSEHSVTIEEKAGTNEKVLWTLNRLQPDVLHILGKDGEYIESIPLEGKVPWFDQEATNKVYGAKRRAQNRAIDRVRALHASDTEKAGDDAAANAAAIKSVVHTFPQQISPRDRQGSRAAASERAAVNGQERIADPNRAGTLSGQRSRPGVAGAVSQHRDAGRVELPSRVEGRARSSARGAFAKADRIHEIQRHLDDQRNGHAQRVHTLARRVAEVTDQDLEDLTSDDGLEPVAAPTATRMQTEAEDDSDCIL
jgi:hypothetical protein